MSLVFLSTLYLNRFFIFQLVDRKLLKNGAKVETKVEDKDNTEIPAATAIDNAADEGKENIAIKS